MCYDLTSYMTHCAETVVGMTANFASAFDQTQIAFIHYLFIFYSFISSLIYCCFTFSPHLLPFQHLKIFIRIFVASMVLLQGQRLKQAKSDVTVRHLLSTASKSKAPNVANVPKFRGHRRKNVTLEKWNRLHR